MDELKEYFIECFDKSDKWGSTIIVLFTVANEINHREEPTPGAWGYSPGLANDPRETEDYLFDVCERAELKDLIKFGNVLERYTRNLERAGYSY